MLHQKKASFSRNSLLEKTQIHVLSSEAKKCLHCYLLQFILHPSLHIHSSHTIPFLSPLPSVSPHTCTRSFTFSTTLSPLSVPISSTHHSITSFLPLFLPPPLSSFHNFIPLSVQTPHLTQVLTRYFKTQPLHFTPSQKRNRGCDGLQQTGVKSSSFFLIILAHPDQVTDKCAADLWRNVGSTHDYAAEVCRVNLSP